MTSRIKNVIVAFVVIVIPLTCSGAHAGEKEDREAIRVLFHQEQDGHRLGRCRLQDWPAPMAQGLVVGAAVPG